MNVEKCVRCGKTLDDAAAAAMGKTNGLCPDCATRKRVTYYAIICASTDVHQVAEDGETRDAVGPNQGPAEEARKGIESTLPDCGPHRVVALRSNRVRILASRGEHKEAKP